MSEKFERCKLFIRSFPKSTPALFLDRDGVVIEDGHHLCDPREVRVCQGARELIADANRQGWPVVVITNQSGISRGLFNWNDVKDVNARMQLLLGAEAQLAAIYVNGYGPDAPPDSWRKPSPQMLLEAATALNLDLKRSLLIGDRLSDLQAGASAGVAIVFHVLSGHGRSARSSVVQWQEQRYEAGEIKDATALQLLDSLESFPFPLLKQGKQTP